MDKKTITRREFLKASATAAGSILVNAACQDTGSPTAHPTLEIVPSHGPTLTQALTPSESPPVWAGRVRDLAGRAIANARVTLVSPDGSLFREARSDAEGSYQFQDAPAGSFNLGASALGYEFQEAQAASGGLEFSLGPDVHPGRWSVIGDTEPEKFGGTNSGVLMPDGRIIYCHDTVRPVVFDPLSGQKELPALSPSIQGCHMVSYLPDGRIFYVGGGDVDKNRNFNNLAVRTVKAFDPATLSWEVFPELSEKRWYPGLALLSDGRCLVFGGGGQPERLRIESCEIFDPRTRTWTTTGSLTTPGGFGPAMLLLTGELLVTWWPPQLYNVASGQWRRTGAFRQPLRSEKGAELPSGADHPDFSAILLEDGRVAAIGARGTAGSVMVEMYDPIAGEWSLGSSPEVVRSMPEVLRLPTGKILVAAGKNEGDGQAPGGYTNEFGFTNFVDLYDPLSGKWQKLSPMRAAREYHAVTLLLPDGRVAVTAGSARPGRQPPPAANTEIEAFEPPYLFRGPRPQIISLSSRNFSNGETISLEIGRTAAPSAVVMMGMNAITHWMDGGVPRRLSLPFNQEGVRITCQIPDDPVLAMPGFYLLFVMVDDIPSEGEIVSIA